MCPHENRAGGCPSSSGGRGRPVPRGLGVDAGPALAQQLKQQRDKLRQYQKRITQQLEREREIARQLLRDGRKERAKLLLKKKRYREQLLDKTENQITSLETMVQSIEFTQIEMKVMEGLQFGNECLNKMHQVMSIEEVERILDETQEAVEYQRQIDELLAGSFTQEDEAAILEELDAITQVTGPPRLRGSRIKGPPGGLCSLASGGHWIGVTGARSSGFAAGCLSRNDRCWSELRPLLHVRLADGRERLAWRDRFCGLSTGAAGVRVNQAPGRQDAHPPSP
uniref:Charged multivesicular body protein 6 n=1 Tax=Sus scrofa TaxID=9823 RepID=A0A8D1ZMI9_PIG